VTGSNRPPGTSSTSRARPHHATSDTSSGAATRATPASTSHATYTICRPVVGWIRRPMMVPATTLRPVSSQTSRTAASSSVSPDSTSPDGRVHSKEPSATARRSSKTRPSPMITAAATTRSASTVPTGPLLSEGVERPGRSYVGHDRPGCSRPLGIVGCFGPLKFRARRTSWVRLDGLLRWVVGESRFFGKHLHCRVNQGDGVLAAEVKPLAVCPELLKLFVERALKGSLARCRKQYGQPDGAACLKACKPRGQIC
jgi:hypothetical protein